MGAINDPFEHLDQLVGCDHLHRRIHCGEGFIMETVESLIEKKIEAINRELLSWGMSMKERLKQWEDQRTALLKERDTLEEGLRLLKQAKEKVG